MIAWVWSTYVLPAMLSVLKDPAIWILLGPAIFRFNFFFANSLWDHGSKKSEVKAIDFRNHRFLAYYTVHLTTLILAWILLLVRYFPEFIDMASHLAGKANVSSLGSFIYGVIWAALLLGGGIVFWFKPLFVSPELIAIYRAHNLPKPTGSPEENMLGPSAAPNCSLTKIRIGLFWFTIVVAAIHPFI